MEKTQSEHPWIVAVTGASGTVYARTLIKVIVDQLPHHRLDVVFSDAALRVMAEEEKILSSVNSLSVGKIIGSNSTRVAIHNNRDIGANIASGSYQTSGMVIVPCSMSTLAAVASGLGENLIHRAADVTLKEGRPLVLVPRETPLSAIHLENMLKLSRAGVRIVPAMPGFYHQPASLEDLVKMMVMKITDQMGLNLTLVERWKAAVVQPKRALQSV